MIVIFLLCLLLDFSFPATPEGNRAKNRKNFVAIEIASTMCTTKQTSFIFKIVDAGVTIPVVQRGC